MQDQPLKVAVRIRKEGELMHFDLSESSPPCAGPMNSVIATTRSSIYLAIKHVFPGLPINAGLFEPLRIEDPDGTFLYAKYPRPVSGCAAEVSQRIPEAVFDALQKTIPQRMFAAPAGTTANLAIGGDDPMHGRSYVTYVISGGGYGGHPAGDGLTNGCSTIGISKAAPVEVQEQLYPVLFERYAIHEGSGGLGEFRGGMGIHYRIRLRAGSARASMVMDHGKFGPPGAAGGQEGGRTRVTIYRGDQAYVPAHVSKDQSIVMQAGDVTDVYTPGGGGYGNPALRSLQALENDRRQGYYPA